MIQISEHRYKKLKEELVEVKRNLNEAMEAMEAARENGDLRENAEYDAARTAVNNYSRRKVEIENELSNSQIAMEDNSPRITVGSLVEVYRVDASGAPLENARRFRVDNKGDTIIQGVLGVNSSLGKAILNGTSGVYRIVDNGGISYYVKKVHE